MDTTTLFEVFGKNIDSKDFNGFIEKNPSFKIGMPDCGTQYVESKELGVDLLFEADEGAQGGNTKQLRNCQSMFLYSEG